MNSSTLSANNCSSNVPTVVGEELAALGGRRVYFDPMAGNHGDKLIEMGSRMVIARAGIPLVGHPKRADAIIMNGGGAMNPAHQRGFRQLQHYSSNYPDTPLFVLPSSVEARDVDIAQLVAARRASLTIFAREHKSFEQLQQSVFSCEVMLRMDHDMAFALEASDYVVGLRRHLSHKHVLIVERDDAEGTTRPIQTRTGRSMTYYIPRAFKHPLKRIIARRHSVDQSRRSNFAQSAMAMLEQYDPRVKSCPIVSIDVSRKDACSFAEFGRIIAEAHYIVTTRLHVAILGSMLGKDVFLKKGSYHKFDGVYRYSLARRGVQLLD